MEQTKTQMLAYQMENRIEEFEDYHSGCKVLVAGKTSNGNYPITDQNLEKYYTWNDQSVHTCFWRGRTSK